MTFKDCLSLALCILPLLPQIPVDVSYETQILLTIAYCPESSVYRRWHPKQGGVSPFCKEVRASRTLTKVLGGVHRQDSEGVDHIPSPAASEGSARSGGLRGSRAQSRSHARSITSHRSRQSGSTLSWASNNGRESSSESELSHVEEDAPHEDEYAEVREDDAEVLSDGRAGSDGNEGLGHSPIQNTLSGVSHIFSTHEETDVESDHEEKVQPARLKRCQPSPKEDTPSKESEESSSEEEQPTDEALCDKARHLDTNFDAWRRKKIAKGIPGWVTRDTMICDLPEHGKEQPNHPDPVGPPLEYMRDHQVFDGVWSDIYDLCRFYILGTTGDPPEFPTPWEPATRGQVRDLLKSAHAIGRPYLIVVHSTDSVTAVSLLRELHTTVCLRQLQVDLQDKSLKLLFCPFCAYAGGNNLSYLNHIIIAHYNTSYGCGKCLKQAFVSSSALHTHKKVCLGLTTKKATGVPDGKPSSGRGDSGCESSSKATPKKNGKAATANSQGSSATLASQSSPRCSGWGTSHHHKSHKKDASKRCKKAGNTSPAQKSAGHKARKDWGCH